MSKMQRDKGARVEREIVQKFREIGFQNVEKIPLSGAAGGSFFGDILVDGRRAEVKARKNEWKTLIRWLEGNDWLVLRADRSEPLIVMTIKTFGDSLDERGPRPSPRAETISAEGGDVAPPYPKERPRPENHPPGGWFSERSDKWKSQSKKKK